MGSIDDLFNSDFFKWQKEYTETYKPLNDVIIGYSKAFEPIANSDLFNITNGLFKQKEKIQEDRQICENNNIWYNLTLDELEAKEHEINDLKQQLAKQSETIKQIQKLSSNYFEDTKPTKKKFIAHTDPTNEVHYFRVRLKPITNYLFNRSNIYQWTQILNGETPAEPIHIKQNRTIKQVLLFFETLKEKQIIKNQYKTALCNLNAIYHNGKPLTTKQLKYAQDSINKNYSNSDIEIKTMIDDILSE